MANFKKNDEKRQHMYKEHKIKIPTPEFVVLYNGEKEMADFKEMRLRGWIRNKIESRIFTIWGLQVMLDSDIAAIYQVEVKRLNEQVSMEAEDIYRMPLLNRE